MNTYDTEIKLPPLGIGQMSLIEQVRRFLEYDPLTGLFTWKEPPPKSRAKEGEVAGKKKTTGYVWIYLCGQEVYAHKAAWIHFYGEIPSKMVDHINGDRADNRICNLRLADLSENNWNWRGKDRAAGTSQHKKTKLWTSKIRHRGRTIYLGCFKTKEDAHKAYQSAAKTLRGEFHEK